MNHIAKELAIFSKAMLMIHGIDDLLEFLHSSECEFLHVEQINILLTDLQLGESLVYYMDSNNRVQSDVLAFSGSEQAGSVYDEKHGKLDQLDFNYYHPELVEHPAYQNIRQFYRVPLGSINQPLGAIEFINPAFELIEGGEEHFRLFSSMLVSFVTHVIDHQQVTNHANRHGEQRDSDHILVDITNAVISQSSKQSLITSLLHRLYPYFGIADLAIVSVDNDRCTQYTVQKCGGEVRQQRHFFKNDATSLLDFKSNDTIVLNRAQLEALPVDHSTFYVEQGIEQVILAPLIFRRETVGKIAYMLREPDSTRVLNINLLKQIAARVALGIHSLQTNQAITQRMPQSTDIAIEETYDQYQIFDDIISQSEVMNRVLDQVAMVADCDATVLIEGESGTGKELIARAIHKMSRRSNKQMVKMNCAAIPEGLFESELFGHERGAFTGAVKNRVGRFEQAHQSTLFLDEIGDLSLELQPKLLRVLQENEIERVGKNQLIQVDVRMVVATNVDLFAMVGNKSFRPDLYYRLNVFPIKLPPLRERAEDIPLLVKHFTRIISRQMGKNIRAISQLNMHALMNFDWPGNVRQLRNFIERSVILTRGEVLNVPVHELPGVEQLIVDATAENSASITIPKAAPEPSDRDAIIAALRESNGIVAGPRGAAAKLGIKRTTLLSRMQKMGISSKDYLSVVESDLPQGNHYE